MIKLIFIIFAIVWEVFNTFFSFASNKIFVLFDAKFVFIIYETRKFKNNTAYEK